MKIFFKYMKKRKRNLIKFLIILYFDSFFVNSSEINNIMLYSMMIYCSVILKLR